MDELEQIIDKVATDPAIKGCVIASGKSAFSGGADLTMLQQGAAHYAKTLKEQGEEAAIKQFFEGSRRLSLLYRKLETCGKPFAIAINGVCLGGAFELALACHYRVMADDDKTQVGLPEIKVGLFPGAGGTQRVARLMQTGDALQFLFKGDQVKPKAALGAKLVHEIAPEAEIVERAKAWIVNGGKAQAPWDAKDFKTPSGKVFSPTRHDDLARRQRHLSPRDLRQLSRRQGHSARRLRRPAIADGSGADGRERAGSRIFCARRKRRR